MSVVLPTTSSVVTQLDHQGYNAEALTKLVKGARKGKAQAAQGKGKKGNGESSLGVPGSPCIVPMDCLCLPYLMTDEISDLHSSAQR